jgi:hypothetical protein
MQQIQTYPAPAAQILGGPTALQSDTQRVDKVKQHKVKHITRV